MIIHSKELFKVNPEKILAVKDISDNYSHGLELYLENYNNPIKLFFHGWEEKDSAERKIIDQIDNRNKK